MGGQKRIRESQIPAGIRRRRGYAASRRRFRVEHRRDDLYLASLFWFSRSALAWRQREKRKPKRFHRQSRRKSHNQDRRIERIEDALPSVSRSASSQSCYPFFWRFARAAFISCSLNRAGSGSGRRRRRRDARGQGIRSPFLDSRENDSPTRTGNLFSSTMSNSAKFARTEESTAPSNPI